MPQIAEAWCRTALSLVEVGISLADIRAQRRIGGTQHIDLLTAVAAEQSEGHIAAAAAHDPPRTTGDLPAS